MNKLYIEKQISELMIANRDGMFQIFKQIDDIEQINEILNDKFVKFYVENSEYYLDFLDDFIAARIKYKRFKKLKNINEQN